MHLTAPSRCHRAAYRRFLREFRRAGEDEIHGLYVKPRSYREFLRSHAAGKYFLMEEGRRDILGIVAFYELDEKERRLDGDIAFSIVPSARGRGLGRQQLALALALCREKGVEKLCITCRRENLGSVKIILANGGELTEEFTHKGVQRQVYWVRL